VPVAVQPTQTTDFALAKTGIRSDSNNLLFMSDEIALPPGNLHLNLS
jgi:hypothetical protein